MRALRRSAAPSEFDGTFEGSGHTISNLTINLPSTGFVGLFGESSGTIRDIGLIGGSVRGGANFVGALVGVNAGTINNSYATTAVNGSQYVGGLVGDNLLGTITNSYATGAVSGGQYVGGLAGQNDAGGTISRSYATGTVSGSSYVGGLVGQNFGAATIDQSYATGAVSGGSNVGGFAGYNFGFSRLHDRGLFQQHCEWRHGCWGWFGLRARRRAFFRGDADRIQLQRLDLRDDRRGCGLGDRRSGQLAQQCRRCHRRHDAIAARRILHDRSKRTPASIDKSGSGRELQPGRQH